MRGYAAYAKVQNTTESPRRVEHRLLSQVNATLREVASRPDDLPKLYDALIWNKKVWDAFMLDLTDENNRLPGETKQILIRLSAWVTKHTFAVMDRDARIEPLIEVNDAILEGLQ